MFVNYPAIFLKEKDVDSYVVIFPDLQGCVTGGETLDKAMEMAQDALCAYLFEFYNKPSKMPKASKLDGIDINIEGEDLDYYTVDGSFKSYVSANLTDYVKKSSTKTIKKTLTIPSYLNEAGMEKNLNFSFILQEALKKELNFD